MRVLWVTAEPPDRNLGGGNIRQAYLLRALAETAQVTLLSVGPVTDEFVTDVAEVVELPAPPPRTESTARRRLRELAWLVADRRPEEAVAGIEPRRTARSALLEMAPSFDVVHVEHGHLAGLIPDRRTNRWTLTLQQLGSERAAHALAQPLGRRHRLFLETERRRAKRFEEDLLRRFDQVMVPSADDAGALGGRALVVENGVDADRFRPSPLPPEPRLLITGSLNYLPNVDGIEWFCREVFPIVVEAVPGATLDIVGRRPVGRVHALAAIPAVTVHPDVPSTVPHLEHARVAVVPLRIGSGTRLKALEAMAAGRPVVGTTIGLAGLDLVDGTHAHVADDPAAQAAATIQLLRSDEDAAALTRNARRHVEDRFTWRVIGPRFASIVTAV